MRPQQRFGRYEVLDVIGAGGFATVYRATDPNLDATVAIKVLADNRAHDPEIRRRFRNEAVLLRRVQTEGHVPGIIEVFDIDETDDGRPFFVMGWADQGTLRDRAQGQVYTAADVAPVVDALAATLGALHEAGVVHRDLTPSNVLLRTDRHSNPGSTSRLVPEGQRLVVGDLGLAKDLTADTTALSLVAGTEHYMAPEQLDPSQPIDGRADVFAASALIRDLLTGGGAAEVSAPIAAVLATGMATDPNARQATIDEWRSQLTQAFAAPVAPATTTTAPPTASTTPPAAQPIAPATAASAPASTKRRAPWAAISALVAIAALAVGGWLAFGGGDDSPIAGPSEIVVGETVTYTAPDDAQTVRWIDWAGDRIDGPTLSVMPILPGALTFTLIADGDQATRTVTVLESPDGPTIGGPSAIDVGQAVLFTAETGPGDVGHFWRGPDGVRVDTDELRVQEQTAGDIVIALIAVGDDGIERGTQIEVEVRG